MVFGGRMHGHCRRTVPGATRHHEHAVLDYGKDLCRSLARRHSELKVRDETCGERQLH